ncbi:MAG: c-type cytochrome [Planctomycetes bacterium]|nr:c-type cytochrome [Planctomycetota bacterium]
MLKEALITAVLVGSLALSDARAQVTSPAAPDAAARSYVSRCTGCHTIGKGALTGPDLTRSLTWQPPDLRAAIVRMQDKTGPIAPDEIDEMVAFLRDAQRDARIAAEEQRIAAQFAVELDPPSAELGRKLYLGTAAFENGGTACVACHHFADVGGGALGPDLTGIFARLGRQGLIAATEKPAFKVMAPIYRDRPVTRQEALHLARYFEESDTGPVQRASAPWGAALGLVGIALAGVLLFTRRHAPRAFVSSKKARS